MISYKDSGVDINAGYDAVKRYKESAKKTKIPGLLTDLGSFNGLFSLPSGLKNPVLVSGTDGVGTKLDIAFRLKKFDTVGIDCVAMSVNDILCSGVKSLFFLDYIACGKLDPVVAGDIVKGVADGCLESGCALLGGETAEMPGFYDIGKYDLAGFAVGAGERDNLLTGKTVKTGDILVGLSSTGVHSNGFSLVRKLVEDYSAPYEDDCGEYKTIGDALLTPTRIYVKPVMEMLETHKGAIHAMSHITGGGFIENIPRMFTGNENKSLTAKIKKGSWKVLPIFNKLLELGADSKTIYNTFNMGVGLVLCVDCDKADTLINDFNNYGKSADDTYSKMGLAPLSAYKIGEVTTGPGGVIIG